MRDRAPALRVYRGLLWLYPAEFRDHFAGEMCRALADWSTELRLIRRETLPSPKGWRR